MGNDAKTTVSDDFKMLEAEMQLRHEGEELISPHITLLLLLLLFFSRHFSADVAAAMTGMEKLHASAQTYIKSLSKRREGDDKEKMIPVDIVGQSMVSHGEEFEDDSQFGQCLACKFLLSRIQLNIYICTY